MTLMDGKKLQKKFFAEFKLRVASLKAKNKDPKLVIVQLGNNTASNIYIKHKQTACNLLGIQSENIRLPESTSFEELKEEINTLNNDKHVTGILIQFPLPHGMSKREVSRLVDPQKDADGVHPYNQGATLMDMLDYHPTPCTPTGVMEILKEYKIEIGGKNAVVIGRSNIAGRPMSNMLINANATTSLIHSHTPKIAKEKYLANADIIVTATGSKDVFRPSDVKKNVVIVDIGIIKNIDEKLRGDIDYKSFEGIASYITPVPGGVGPMTVAMLMKNVIEIAEHS